jgi:tetratricopeptide (TPR) repeat protein
LKRALALHRSGAHLEAEHLYSEVLEHYPGDFDALHMLGVLAGQTDRNDQAVALLQRAIGQRADVAAAYGNLALALTATRRMNEAVTAYEHLIALDPTQIDAYTRKAALLYELARPEEALATYERALALDPHNAQHLWNASLCWLLLGEYERGFRLYAARHALYRSTGSNGVNRTERIRAGYLWAGTEDVAGKTVFVQAEQGLGDTLQFCRYLPLLEKRGARVIFSVPPQLRRLLRSLSPTLEITSEEEPRPFADHDSFLLGLPLAFSTTLDTVPAAIPYLAAEPDRVLHWGRRIAREQFKIGVWWQGKVGTKNPGRSFPLASLVAALAMPGVRLISLQHGSGTEQLAALPPDARVEVLGDELHGADAFVDCAAVMHSLDLVISPDTSVAHLAGALGREAWVALKFGADWRWLRNVEHSPWYPNLRLFRQASPGDWDSVFRAMRQRLLQRLGASARTTTALPDRP